MTLRVGVTYPCSVGQTQLGGVNTQSSVCFKTVRDNRLLGKLQYQGNRHSHTHTFVNLSNLYMMINTCAFDSYLNGQTASLPHLANVEQITPRVLRVLGQNPGKVSLLFNFRKANIVSK